MPGPVRIDVGPTASLRLGLDNLPVGVDQLSERLPDWLPRSTLVRKVTDHGIVLAQDAADHLPEGTVRVPVWRPHWNLNLKLRQ